MTSFTGNIANKSIGYCPECGTQLYTNDFKDFITVTILSSDGKSTQPEKVGRYKCLRCNALRREDDLIPF